ncbi:hypothetical protein Zm00014a_039548 [Zea mays]|uniref:Uncharacterized protein n=1 Tax=Zea mays TaxID=4577 RepID=A0A3L6FC02_MAIZE|nr:hypothetical protein Zm00014a_039548 [Zea mays]
MSSSSGEFGRRRQDNVEVIFPESQVVGSGNPSSVADNTILASASSASAAADSAALVDKAIAKLPADVRAQATDSKRKAKSQDPGSNSTLPVDFLIRQNVQWFQK